MRYTQFVSFEICRECNFSRRHDNKCPSRSLDRYGDLDESEPLGDNSILVSIAFLYGHLGFTGHIAWHFYNEPTMAWNRMIALMRRVKSRVSRAKFTLWTNGSRLHPDMDIDGLKLFSDVWISNYESRDFEWVREHVDRLVIFGGQLDGRMTPLRREIISPCLRPYNELVIDYYGNGHLCCMDWQGSAKLGNVRTDGFESVVQAFVATRERVGKAPMDDPPEVCKTCAGQQHHIADLVPSVQALTEADQPWKAG